jgi:hypothetical protein
LKHGIRSIVKLRRPKDVVNVGDQLAGLLGTETIDVKAAKEPVHRRLANLPDDEMAVLDFVRRWGRVISTISEPAKTLRHSQELFVGPAAEATKMLRAAHPEKEEDWDAPVLFFESQPRIIQLRDLLRCAWANDAQALESLQNTVKEQVGATWAFKQRWVEITVQDAWAAVCLMFLLDHAAGKIERCKNPECPARFFIKKRKNQKVCEAGVCVAYAVHERTSDWWKKHGNEWRAERRKKTKKKAVKGDK